MSVATAQTIFTYVIVLVVVIGGGVMLFALRNDPANGLSTLVGGFIGAALTWTFGREIGAATAREAARQTLVTNGNPNGHALS